MDPASAAPSAGSAGIPAAPRTPAFSPPSAGRSQTDAPPPAGSSPPHTPRAAPARTVPRLSSLLPLPILPEDLLLPDFCSGATGLSGRFSEGFSLRRSHVHQTRHGIDEDMYTGGNQAPHGVSVASIFLKLAAIHDRAHVNAPVLRVAQGAHDLSRRDRVHLDENRLACLVDRLNDSGQRVAAARKRRRKADLNLPGRCRGRGKLSGQNGGEKQPQTPCQRPVSHVPLFQISFLTSP